MKTYSRHEFTREERAARAKVAISAAFESKEQAFLDFVLSHYVRVGVQELDQEKLTPQFAVASLKAVEPRGLWMQSAATVLRQWRLRRRPDAHLTLAGVSQRRPM